MERDAPTLRDVTHQIAAYLVTHPAATDSIRGIQRWWLKDTETTTRTIEQALQWLTKEGAVSRTVLADGTTVYSAHRGGTKTTRSRRSNEKDPHP